MPFVRRRPLLRMAAVGGVAYMGAKAGSNRAAQAQQAQAGGPAPAAPAAAPDPAPAPAPAAAPATDPVAQLQQLAQLHQSGALSDQEFSEAKARILS
jgi:hypothetical protein